MKGSKESFNKVEEFEERRKPENMPFGFDASSASYPFGLNAERGGGYLRKR